MDEPIAISQNRFMRMADIEFAGDEIWRPVNDQQLTALHSDAQLVLFGGQSGGGKTDFLIGDAINESDNPNFRGLLIRRSFAEMPQIIDRTRAVYSQMGATYRDSPHHIWKFPSGAQLRLGYISSTGDIGNYQGNPFSWLGIDESTYLQERSVRDIIPWMVSTDPSLFCRARLTTNPGQIGADWHLRVFLRDSCPVHQSAKSVIPGAIYKGTTWMDGRPTHLTTSFIPSSVRDNPFYGQEKIDRLRSQTAEASERLLTGCWCSLEGAYFRFLRREFMCPLIEAEDAWWKRHIISVDYGFAGSWAAAGLYVISEPSFAYPRGRMAKIGELTEHEMGSEDFAKLIGRAFIEPTVGGKQRQFEYAVFDPANDAHVGTGKSNMDIMRGVLEDRYKVACIKAAKDRIGNFQNLYRLLKQGPPEEMEKWTPGDLIICDSCPVTFASLQTRIHDPKKPGDILKVDGKVEDDLLDETSYAANTFFSASAKPRDVEINETLNRYRDDGLDHHSLNIHRARLEMETKNQQRYEGTSIGGRRIPRTFRRT